MLESTKRILKVSVLSSQHLTQKLRGICQDTSGTLSFSANLLTNYCHYSSEDTVTKEEQYQRFLHLPRPYQKYHHLYIQHANISTHHHKPFPPRNLEDIGTESTSSHETSSLAANEELRTSEHQILHLPTPLNLQNNFISFM